MTLQKVLQIDAELQKELKSLIVSKEQLVEEEKIVLMQHEIFCQTASWLESQLNQAFKKHEKMLLYGGDIEELEKSINYLINKCKLESKIAEKSQERLNLFFEKMIKFQENMNTWQKRQKELKRLKASLIPTKHQLFQ